MQTIEEKHERNMKTMREEMHQQFSQMMSLIQQKIYK
jgi:hypothetical protein